MKKFKRFSMMLAALYVVFGFTLSSCDKDVPASPVLADEKAMYDMYEVEDDCPCLINPADTIYPEEIDMLLYMREEEKLARDVYIALYGQYNLPIFNHISKSEQYHMDRVLCLLDYYNIPDPASPDTGVFINPDLQGLYDNLIAQGTVSLIDALTVGATIEDVDIYDLEESISATSNEAIINIFSRLQCGSSNHLRSFSILLDRNDVTYEPQFISPEEYNEIISADHEFCGGISD